MKAIFAGVGDAEVLADFLGKMGENKRMDRLRAYEKRVGRLTRPGTSWEAVKRFPA